MAVGAGPGTIGHLVMRQGLIISVVGFLVGGVSSAILAIALRRPLSTVLRGVAVTDPISWTVATLVLLGVSICANSLPAWRAAHMNPSDALRRE